ncbi:hypothetical protein HDZ31DRAFT_70441, partial [Schizophyllum fasciatum]
AVVGGWALTDQGFQNEAYTGVGNSLIGQGMYTALKVGDDEGYFLSWLNDTAEHHFNTQWYIVFDSTEGAATC